MRIIQGMYANAHSRVRVNGQLSEEFGVGVGVHQGSVLSPLLFITVREALLREFRTGDPWELLYADDLVIIAGTLEGGMYIHTVKRGELGHFSKLSFREKKLRRLTNFFFDQKVAQIGCLDGSAEKINYCTS